MEGLKQVFGNMGIKLSKKQVLVDFFDKSSILFVNDLLLINKTILIIPIVKSSGDHFTSTLM